MLRSSCSNRVSSEFFLDSPDSQSLSLNQHVSETVLLDKQLLPIYNPLSRAAEKERSHLRSAENAVHIIPFVLVFCGFILWLFSSIVSFHAIGYLNLELVPEYRFAGTTMSRDSTISGGESACGR
ncbi:hypothetical protein Godav_025653 [Gossypium davidsonii]|uniref:Uncharacterized protein n=1 Tax=Gossypium davidsonii TaxID=34287 RepID=A0A7J8TGT3_GOSDV|nr:hypothetical protein [Gossypium davidsonii]